VKIAVIPARGGSKRIPRKNVKLFCGKPMIAWSIEAALQSGCFDEVIVSTDDDEIRQAALRFGATVPFMRPAALADDYTTTIHVMQHAARWYLDRGTDATYLCCLYATAPFVTAEDLAHGFDVLVREQCDYVFSVTRYDFPIQRALKIRQDNRVEMFNTDFFNIRSQDLEEAYHDAGQFYWGRTRAWLDGEILFSTNALPILLPRHRVQDIDTQEDWLRAEWLFKALRAL